MKARYVARFFVVVTLGAQPCADVFAQIYKCIDGSKTSYQDQPCRDAAAAKTFTPIDTKGITPAPTADDGRLKAPIDELPSDRHSREVAKAIDRAERDLRDYDSAEVAEIAALREKRRYGENTQAMQPSEIQLRQIDEEIESTAQRYKILRQAARERIAQLRKTATDLDAPLIAQ